MQTQIKKEDPLNILVLYNHGSTYINTVQEYLESFSKYSRHNIYYADGLQGSQCITDLSLFDVVAIHYSLRLCLPDYISTDFAKALQKYEGLKVLFIQDEYNHTNLTIQGIRDLGINLVFSCVPPQYKEAVYPIENLPNVEFIHILTGAVPLHLEKFHPVKPLSQRDLLIGYRGRVLPYYLGELAREKFTIGQKMRQICEERGLLVDIECDDNKRIYGDAWYEFLQNCRATLGTESGSNVFDFDGSLERTIQQALKINPALTYEEAYQRWIAPHEGLVKMNQISPKIFESIALQTALILFEGSYSGVIQPELHYIPLKKDFSNIDEVLDKIQDDEYLQDLTRRTYQDIIETGAYSYKSFIEYFDSCIEQCVIQSRNVKLKIITGIVGYMNTSTHETQLLIPRFNEGLPLHQTLDCIGFKLIKPLPTINLGDLRLMPNYSWRKPGHKIIKGISGAIETWNVCRLKIRQLKSKLYDSFLAFYNQLQEKYLGIREY